MNKLANKQETILNISLFTLGLDSDKESKLGVSVLKEEWIMKCMWWQRGDQVYSCYRQSRETTHGGWGLPVQRGYLPGKSHYEWLHMWGYLWPDMITWHTMVSVIQSSVHTAWAEVAHTVVGPPYIYFWVWVSHHGDTLFMGISVPGGTLHTTEYPLTFQVVT